MASNPAGDNLPRYSASSSAPARQPTQSSTCWRISAGMSSPRATRDPAKRPPGLSTRKASVRTRSLSAERLMTQLEMMTSTEASGSGMLSIWPLRNSTFSSPALALLELASASISSVMSRPYARPVGPTRRAESSTSMPPPEPRSRTTSPGFNSASAVGLPQPSEARTASGGRADTSSIEYRARLTSAGAPGLQHESVQAAAPSQQDVPAAVVGSTDSAATPRLVTALAADA